MQEQFADIINYSKGVVRRKWVIVITAWLVCLIGWGVVYKLPNQYASEARVHVDTRTMLRPLMRGIAIDSDVRGLVAIMKRLMFTQENLLKIAELAGLEGDAKSEKGRYLIVESLKKTINIGMGREEIFSISYMSPNPAMAQSVVQAVLSVFSEQTQQSTLGDVASAQRFIDDQIREYEQRLRNAEKARENFKRANLGMLPGESGEGQVARVQAIQQTIESIEMMIAELSSKRETLQTQLDEAQNSSEEWGLTELPNKSTASAEDARIAALNEKRDQLLVKYTEKHPEIVALDAMIKDLQKQKEQKAQIQTETQSDEGMTLPMSSPYVQMIKGELNKIEVDLSSLNTRLASFKEKLQHENTQVQSRLSIETEMQNLNRDYDTIRDNYLKLLERREEAKISEKMDAQSSSLKFKVIDPANHPLKPTSPNRKLFYSMVTGAGIVLGAVLAVALSLIYASFADVRSIRHVTGLPVLGYISKLEDPKETQKRRMGNVLFLIACGLLLVSYASIMVSEFALNS